MSKSPVHKTVRAQWQGVCGAELSNSEHYAWRWENVTCKNCLRESEIVTTKTKKPVNKKKGKKK